MAAIRGLSIWAWIFVLLGLALFLFRGPMRGAAGAVDYAVTYAEARTWLNGGTPYATPAVIAAYDSGKGPERLRPVQGYTDSINAPTLLPLVAVIASLPWTTSLWLWLGAESIAWFAAVVMAFSFSGMKRPLARGALLGLALCFAPAMGGLYMGQASVLAVALLILAFTSPKSGGRLAGLLLGASICLKPHLGLPFLLVPLLTRRWKMLLPAVCFCGGALTIAILPLVLHHPGWYSMWMENLRLTTSAGHVNDPSPVNPDSWKFLNAQPLLMLFMKSALGAQTLAWALALPAFALWAYLSTPLLNNARYAPAAWLPLAGLTLLAIYHRTYDAGILLLAVPSLAVYSRLVRRCALALSAAILPFIVPLPAYFAIRFPAWREPGHIVTGLALRHQTILIAAMSALSLYALAMVRKTALALETGRPPFRVGSSLII